VNRQILFDTLGWGIILWLIGYILGIVLFMIAPVPLIGWVILPIGTVIALFVLFKKIKSSSLNYYLLIAVLWTLIAITFDYFLLVKLFNPPDGYYKFDVYLYYALTFSLPLIVGFLKTRKKTSV